MTTIRCFRNPFILLPLLFAHIAISAQRSQPGGPAAVSPVSEVLVQNQTIRDSLFLWEERIYLHTDRSEAAPGEYLFFKAYAMTGPQKFRVSPSGVMKVDLIDPSGTLASSQYYQLSDGMAQGAVEIPEDLEPNTYQLRAYTRWMQNYGPQQFFTRQIRVLENGEVTTGASLKQVAEVRFYPEGGSLLKGMNNKIIIRALDALGCPVSLAGEIRDSAGRRVVDVYSYEEGLGMSILTPEPGAAYTLHLENGQRFSLPAVQDAGYAMQVNPLHPDHITVSVGAVGMKKSPLQLTGRIGEKVFMEQPLELEGSGSLQIEIPKKQMPSGIVHFDLLGADGEVLSERPVRIEGPESLKMELVPLAQDFTQGGKNTFRLKITDASGNPVQTEVSLSVIRDTGSRLPGISDYLRPNPGSAEIGAFRKALFLDDLNALATASGNSGKDLPNEILYPIQEQLELIGYAYDLNNELLRNQEIQVMSSTDENLFISEVRTDPSGILKVSGIDFSGEIPLIFRTKGEDTRTNLVRFEPLHEEIYQNTKTRATGQPLAIKPPETEVKRKGRPLVETTPWAVIDTTGLIRLAQATVTAKKQEVKATPSVYGIEPKRVIRQDPKKPYNSIGELLQRMPGVFVTGDVFTVPNVSVPSLPPGPTRWVVDGLMLVANEHPFDLVPIMDIERIELLSASDASIYGSRGTGPIFAIYTRNGSDVDYVSRKDAMVTFKGFAPGLPFEEYLQQRNKDRKLRKQEPATLYWNPAVTTDESGEALIEFTSPADYDAIRIQLEAVTPEGSHGSLQDVLHRPDLK
ncbi:TonB-dependent receptor [Robiginitalea sediminis]|uniref:TonB-dependent receptor n=1 Tax=Robiginitalea sediminis TaxID=1982593 RepID=UPI000B4AD2A6|nr:Plug domain-containing protein [Robiginitalea sediminis]